MNVLETMADASCKPPEPGIHRSAFESMFHPRTVAVIGATDREGSVGRTLLLNLKSSEFQGRVFPINPNRQEVLGLLCYPTLASVPAMAGLPVSLGDPQIDLAVIATPAPSVPSVIEECIEAGVRSAVVISAGFKESGVAGTQLEARIREQLKRSSMRLIGPNCLGIMNPLVGLNATFSHEIALRGNVAFLSQSGALLTAILDWSLKEQVGFSAIVSTGSMLDVGWADLIDYFGDDPNTQSILLYMESVGDARSFLSAAREVALRKPIIVIKAGRSEAAAHAASSHTGALTGSDEVFDAALRRCGVLRVQNISDLFYMAETLARQPRPMGPRLTILTNAGGPGVLATDALIANGGELAPLSEASKESLSQFLSPNWSHANPIDILGDSGPEQYARAVDIAVNDPQSDGLLVILAPQGMTNPAEVAKSLAPYAKGHGKPILASWMGGSLISEGEAILNKAGIPTFPYPDTAARAFDSMWRYSVDLHGLYETPTLANDLPKGAAAKASVAEIVEGVRQRGRTLLTEAESKQVLASYGIPTVETRVARSEDQALRCAREIGFPVALKLHSEAITHKTDVGGVKLNLQNEAAVSEAYRAIESSVRETVGEGFLGVTVQPMVKLEGYELILGSSIDPQFGPVVLFGSGGQLVEIYKDRALGLPPFTATLAQRLMERTQIFRALKGVRGRKAVPLEELERMIVRFSQLVVEQPWIKEIDINPLLASPEKILALDARVILHPPDTREGALPRPAIRPYPAQYVAPFRMKDGAQVTIRPIQPEDEPAMITFHGGLSEESVYLRYFHQEKLSTRIAHDRLMRSCFIDYDREMALIAECQPADGTRRILGVSRLIRSRAENSAEIAVVVSDGEHKQGLGTELLRRLVQFAHDEKIHQVVANFLPENRAIRQILEGLGFVTRTTNDPHMLAAAIEFD